MSEPATKKLSVTLCRLVREDASFVLEVPADYNEAMLEDDLEEILDKVEESLYWDSNEDGPGPDTKAGPFVASVGKIPTRSEEVADARHGFPLCYTCGEVEVANEDDNCPACYVPTCPECGDEVEAEGETCASCEEATDALYEESEEPEESA